MKLFPHFVCFVNTLTQNQKESAEAVRPLLFPARNNSQASPEQSHESMYGPAAAAAAAAAAALRHYMTETV